MEFIVFVNLFVAVWLAYQAGEAETGSKGRTICLAFSVANALVVFAKLITLFIKTGAI